MTHEYELKDTSEFICSIHKTGCESCRQFIDLVDLREQLDQSLGNLRHRSKTKTVRHTIEHAQALLMDRGPQFCSSHMDDQGTIHWHINPDGIEAICTAKSKEDLAGGLVPENYKLTKHELGLLQEVVRNIIKPEPKEPNGKVTTHFRQ